MKKYFALLLGLALLLGTMATAGASPVGGLNVGEIVRFGRYEQDNDLSNGPEPIEWLVLQSDGGTATLISRYGLDYQPYNDRYSADAVTWQDCTLRAWLASDFPGTAFSAEERAQLLPVRDTAPETCLDGTLQDTVSLLSLTEYRALAADVGVPSCQATAYADALGAGDNKPLDGTCSWWMCTGGLFWSYYAVIGSHDSYSDSGAPVYYGQVVRPVIRLKRGAIETASAAGEPTGTAPEVTEPTGDVPEGTDPVWNWASGDVPVGNGPVWIGPTETVPEGTDPALNGPEETGAETGVETGEEKAGPAAPRYHWSSNLADVLTDECRDAYEEVNAALAAVGDVRICVYAEYDTSGYSLEDYTKKLYDLFSDKYTVVMFLMTTDTPDFYILYSPKLNSRITVAELWRIIDTRINPAIQKRDYNEAAMALLEECYALLKD